MTAFVVEQFGCERLQLADYDGHLGQSKWTHIKGLARQSLQLLAALPRLRDADCIVTIGPVTHGHLLRLLKRLHVVRYRRSIALGWYVHSERLFPLLRLLTRLDGKQDRYILFSEWEVELYRTRLGIPAERLEWLPYGAWGTVPATTEPPRPADAPEDGYYFAGGYSNRDYLPLIEAFRGIAAPLVIVCSVVNTELDSVDLPPNVSVMRDVPGETFDAYIRHCKACIVPLKRDTGASGQSVTLRAMRLGKPIVAPDFGGVRGYVVPGASGWLVRDVGRDVRGIVASIERDPGEAERFGAAARQRYERYFSPEAGRVALSQILAPLLA